MSETAETAFPRALLLWSAALLGAAAVAGLLGFAISAAATLEDLDPIGRALAIWAFGLLLLVPGVVVGALGVDAALAWLAVRRGRLWHTARWVLPVLALLALIAAAVAVLGDSTFTALAAVIVGFPWLAFVSTAVVLLARALRARPSESSVSSTRRASGP